MKPVYSDNKASFLELNHIYFIGFPQNCFSSLRPRMVLKRDHSFSIQFVCWRPTGLMTNYFGNCFRIRLLVNLSFDLILIGCDWVSNCEETTYFEIWGLKLISKEFRMVCKSKLFIDGCLSVIVFVVADHDLEPTCFNDLFHMGLLRVHFGFALVVSVFGLAVCDRN